MGEGGHFCVVVTLRRHSAIGRTDTVFIPDRRMPVPLLTRRVASRAAVTAALGLALLGGAAAPAFAQTTNPLPVVGTTACNTAVTGAVTTYQTALNTARTNLVAAQNTSTSTPADIAQLTAAVSAAQSQLTAAIKAQTGLLCVVVGVGVGTPGTPATPGHTTVRDPRTRFGVESQREINDAIDGLSCTSTNTNVQAIDKAIAARQAAHLPVADSQRRLDAKIASLSCSSGSVTPAAAAQTAKDCGCAPTTVTEPTTVVTAPAIPSVTSKTVSATADDNSVATTSGSEVKTVPEGSASTGAA